MTDFKADDDVSWNTPQRQTKGKVVKKVSSDTDFEGLEIAANQDDPRYIVRSGSSGKPAAHKAESLKKL